MSKSDTKKASHAMKKIIHHLQAIMEGKKGE